MVFKYLIYIWVPFRIIAQVIFYPKCPILYLFSRKFVNEIFFSTQLRIRLVDKVINKHSE